MSASQRLRDLSGVSQDSAEFVQPCPARLRCSTCGVVDGALRNGRCGHGFCPACCKTDKGVVKVCPVDRRQLLDNELVVQDIESEVLRLEVFCPSRRRGCKKTLPLRALQGHTRSCGFVAVLCPCECGLEVCRRELAEHLASSCDRRLLPCQHCREEVPFKETQEHLNGCGKRPMVCPFCKTQITREQMSSHEVSCPERPRLCPLSQIGCKFKGNAEDLRLHEEDIKSHMHVLVNAVSTNKSMVQKVLDRVSSLSKQVTQLQDEFKDVQRNNAMVKELKQSVIHLQESVKNLSERMDQESRKIPKVHLNHGDSGRSSPAMSDTSRGAVKYSAPPTSL